jgi:hypothetical protein
VEGIIGLQGRQAGRVRYGRLGILVAALVLAVAVGAGIYAAARPAVPAGPAAGSATSVTDGWMPMVEAQERERQAALASSVTDGWAAALQAAERARLAALANEVTDGWAGRLLH